MASSDDPRQRPDDTRPTSPTHPQPAARVRPAAEAPPSSPSSPAAGDPATVATAAGVGAARGARALEQTIAESPLTQASTPTRATVPARTPGVGPQPTGVTQLHIETTIHNSEGTHCGEVWGDFRIGDLIGRGGMGAVYKGVQISLDRPVAIKVLPQHLSVNESFRERFQREAKAVAMLSSPHVIQVYAAGVHEGHHYFAMEFVEGTDLSRRVRDGLRLSFRETLDFTIQAARGLAAAGELGIVHRDIKPANMMVTSRNVLKLMDFGLVKLASDEHAMTLAGTVMGTVSYFSPEQGRGESCDQRTDIYALGVVLYELLTGRLPFTGSDATSIIYQHIHVAPRPPKEIDPTIPEGFQAVVLKCLQKLPDDRYADAQALLADLQQLARDQPPTIALRNPALLRTGATVLRDPPFAHEQGTARPARWPLAAGIAAGIAALAGGGCWWALTHRPPAAAPAPIALTPAAPPASAAAVVPVAGAAGAAPAPAPVALVPAVPAPALAPPGSGDGSAPAATPEQVRGLVRAGHLEEARRLADQGLAGDPTSAEWANVGHAVDVAQGAALLVRLRAALDQDDLDAARTSAEAAKQLIPDSAELAELGTRLAKIQARRQERADAIARAETLLASSDWAMALPLLEQLDTQKPGESAVATLLVRAHALEAASEHLAAAVKEQLAAADAAMLLKDYDVAGLAFAAAQQLDPRNADAASGLQRIIEAKAAMLMVSTAFDAALGKGDLAEGQRQLDRLQELAPHAALTASATQKLSDARVAAAKAQHEAALAEASLKADTAALLAKINDPAQQPDSLGREVAALVASMDAGRPERAELQQALDDRTAHDQVAAGLIRLDAAVLAGDAGGIAAMVDDREFAQGLAQLKPYAGLVFSSRITAFTRHDQEASAQVVIRHALAVYPLRELTYDLTLHRGQDSTWHILVAHLHPL